MLKPAKLPEALLTGPFTVSDAMAAGVGYGRLKHNDLARPSRGIRYLEDDGDQFLSLARPCSRVSAYSAASHATAFDIWGIPGWFPRPEEQQIHISRRADKAVPRRRGVIGHQTQLFDDEIVCWNGLWITTRVRTWLDVSRVMSVDELTVVVDYLVRIPRPQFEFRSEPYATLTELTLMLEQARVGSDSAPETRLRLAVVRAGLPAPELNRRVELADGTGREPDLSFSEYRVAAEYEGEGHSVPDQIIRDISREEDFIRAGWIQVRISKRHMVNGAAPAIAKIRTALLSRGWSPMSGFIASRTAAGHDRLSREQ